MTNGTMSAQILNPAATAHNNSLSAPPSAALRFASVLGPGTLDKRLTGSPVCLARLRANFGILEARAPRRASDKFALRANFR